MDRFEPVQKVLDFPEQSSSEVPLLQRIRIETVLSRFPIHTLSKKGTVEICITQRGNMANKRPSVTT